MSEPISSTAAGIAGWSAISKLAAVSGLGSALAAYVVMKMTKPKDEEWGMTILCTLIGSILGGAAFMSYFNLQHWTDHFLGLMGMGGVFFTCGLPAWLGIRALFAFMNKNKDKDLKEIVQEVKDIV